MPCSYCDAEKVFSRGLCSPCYYRKRANGSPARKNVRNIGLCSEDGCRESAVSKGLCYLHYSRAQHPLKTTWKIIRSRHPNDIPSRWQDFDDFVADVGERPTRKHKLCRVDTDKPYSTENVQWVEPIKGSNWPSHLPEAERTEYQHAWRLRKQYGITAEDYARMRADQGGVCAICGNGQSHNVKNGAPARLCVDHCHTTGKVRGLLCVSCNRMLGYARDDPKLLRGAIGYLRRG